MGGLWCDQKTRDLIQSLNEEADLANYKPLEIDERWKDIEPDVLADMALETFDMVPGSIWGPYGNDRIVLEGFPVGEIEVSLDHLGIDHITMGLIRESCDAYISGTDCAYVQQMRYGMR